MKIVIVGGVAGGMSAATRLRRLDADAEIIVLEKSGHVSYANCGLPYYVGGIIEPRAASCPKARGLPRWRPTPTRKMTLAKMAMAATLSAGPSVRWACKTVRATWPRCTSTTWPTC